MADDIKAKFGLQRQRSYINRDFDDFRLDLVKYANVYFKDKIQDFSEASMGGLFLDMAAYIGDNMAFYLDHQFREMNPVTAVESKNIEAMVRNAGIKITGNSPASVDIDFYIEVPTITDPASGLKVPDPVYLPMIKENAKLKSNTGIYFNLTHDIDFSEKNINNVLTAEQTMIQDNTGVITSVVLKKSGLCVSGEIIEQSITINGTFVPFRTVSLNKQHVSAILRVYDSEGNDYYEVESLSQDTVYKRNRLSSGDSSVEVITAPYRYITFTDVNSKSTTLRFGSGDSAAIFDTAVPDASDLALPLYGKQTFSSFSLDPNRLLKSPSLGVSPTGTTLKVIYRYGGGANHNVAPDTIRQVSEIQWKFPTNASFNKVQEIKRRLGVGNPNFATGGAAAPSLRDLKSYITTARTMQNRIVTREDLLARIYTLPTEFGIVYRANVVPNPENALASILYVISRDASGKLTTSSDALKQNLSIYLNEFRLIGDAMDILDASVINFKITLQCRFSHNVNKYSLISKILREVKKLYTPEKMALGKPLVMSDILNTVISQPGVVSCLTPEITNLSGTISDREYSADTKRIEVENDVIFAENYEIFELRHPNSDIEITVL
tara:strand:- start:12743 stop:14569 length:1827 start_codon:yes stop_codon:yes gene_type:complete